MQSTWFDSRPAFGAFSGRDKEAAEPTAEVAPGASSRVGVNTPHCKARRSADLRMGILEGLLDGGQRWPGRQSDFRQGCHGPVPVFRLSLDEHPDQRHDCWGSDLSQGVNRLLSAFPIRILQHLGP